VLKTTFFSTKGFLKGKLAGVKSKVAKQSFDFPPASFGQSPRTTPRQVWASPNPERKPSPIFLEEALLTLEKK